MDIYDKILFIIYMFNCGCRIPLSCVRCKQGDRGLIGPQGFRGEIGHTGLQGPGVSGTIDTTTNPTGSYLSLTRIA